MLETVFQISQAKLQSDRIFPMTADGKLINFMKEVANEHLYTTLFKKRYEFT
jgi:hypothetical protein